MEDFNEALKLFWKKIWKKYRVEFFLILLALLITIASLVLYLTSLSDGQNSITLEPEKTDSQSVANTKIYVDLAGAVEKPDLYELTSGARLKDVLKLAGGLSADADRDFFAKNFNLSLLLSDQEKIYIPSTSEVENGFVMETNQQPITNNQASTLININSSDLDQLDQLPGIGKVTAEKIIRQRPYQSIEELLTKKIINKSTFEKIRGLISVN